MAGKSGLVPIQGSNMLHQPHQAGYSDPGFLYSRTYSFTNPAFGSDNMEIALENIQMVLSDAWIKCVVTKTNASTANEIELPPMPFWLSNFGLILRHEGKEVARLTTANLVAYQSINSSYNQILYYRKAENWYTRDAMMDNTATATTGYEYYLSLRPLVQQLLGNLGPLNAYATGKWTLALGFKPLADIYELGSITDITFAISSMKLVLQGHLENDENRKLVSLALAGRGIQVVADYPIEQVQTFTGATISFPFNSTEGDCTGLVLWVRGATAISTATLANRNCRAVLDLLSNRTSADSTTMFLSIGTSGAPNEYLGQPVSFRDLARTYANYSVDWSGPEEYNASYAAQSRGIIVIPFSGKFSLAQQFGIYTGSRSLKNNLVVSVSGSAALSGGYQIHCIALMRRSLGVTHAGVEVVNTYATA